MEKQKPMNPMSELEKLIVARDLLNELIVSKKSEELARRDILLKSKNEHDEWDENIWEETSVVDEKPKEDINEKVA